MATIESQLRINRHMRKRFAEETARSLEKQVEGTRDWLTNYKNYRIALFKESLKIPLSESEENLRDMMTASFIEEFGRYAYIVEQAAQKQLMRRE